MAHLTKFTRAGAGNVLEHNEREREYEFSYGNKEIDHKRTVDNYSFIDDGRRAIDRLRDRLEEVRVLKRADVKVLCGWVVHLPENVPEERSKEFFEKTYDFLENKYGSDNSISAVVHMDETRPHLHYTFVPVVEDKRTGTPKVSAKELITREHLREFHPELKAHLEREMNCEVDILTGATAGGNKTVKELKAQSLAEQLEPKLELQYRPSKLRKNEVVVDKDGFEKVKKKASYFDFATLRMLDFDNEIAVVKRKKDEEYEEYEEKMKNIVKEYEDKLDREADINQTNQLTIDRLKDELTEATEALDASKEQLRVAKEVIKEAGLTTQFDLAMKADKEKKMAAEIKREREQKISDDFELSF